MTWGAGYSGLRQITTVRPSYLKLDRSLICEIDGDPDRGALVSALLGYARQTGGHLVAEGVETAAAGAAPWSRRPAAGEPGPGVAGRAAPTAVRPTWPAASRRARR